MRIKKYSDRMEAKIDGILEVLNEEIRIIFLELLEEK
jgi:hypothetical protein